MLLVQFDSPKTADDAARRRDRDGFQSPRSLAPLKIWNSIGVQVGVAQLISGNPARFYARAREPGGRTQQAGDIFAGTATSNGG